MHEFMMNHAGGMLGAGTYFSIWALTPGMKPGRRFVASLFVLMFVFSILLMVEGITHAGNTSRVGDRFEHRGDSVLRVELVPEIDS